MATDPIRLSRWHRYAFYGVIAALLFSGAIWAWINYLEAPESGAVTKALMMKIHGAAAIAILVLIGMLLTTHVKLAWRARRNRGSGVSQLTIFGLLTITGYALYYAGGENFRTWNSRIHLAIGLILPFLLVIHIWLGRRTRSRKRNGNDFPSKIDMADA
jgi:hypothetical protein